MKGIEMVLDRTEKYQYCLLEDATFLSEWIKEVFVDENNPRFQMVDGILTLWLHRNVYRRIWGYFREFSDINFELVEEAPCFFRSIR